ncbi:hypothetical protein TPY_3024 [Sulfobacillus acidophilus TPY]|uniref:Uncharacterized protein n=1 Tax=Sulfobacillus acidophilus (strain ATCC 700253 / DSM 10332 / NAL) TaxID=679936 RepID=G8TS45_SULAD|nr:hypothetical protein TPY_3024 [Sulfobacillus acidophilus TPY]AEW04371.1 hypothetical protein Sulac_0868 [Sulfobacillus acidophilus DSM 10332]
MQWPEFHTFYAQLSSEKLGNLVQSVTDPAFYPWEKALSGLPPEVQKQLTETIPPIVTDIALAVSTHLLHAYHDWLKTVLNTEE